MTTAAAVGFLGTGGIVVSVMGAVDNPVSSHPRWMESTLVHRYVHVAFFLGGGWFLSQIFGVDDESERK